MAPKRKIDPAPPPSRTPRRLLAERGIVDAWLIPASFPLDTQRQYARLLAQMALRYHDPRVHPHFPALVRELLADLDAAPDDAAAAEPPPPDARLPALVEQIALAHRAALAPGAPPDAVAALRDAIVEVNAIVRGARARLDLEFENFYYYMFGNLTAYPAPPADALDVAALAELADVRGKILDETVLVQRDAFIRPGDAVELGDLGPLHRAARKRDIPTRAYVLRHLGLHQYSAEPAFSLDLSSDDVRAQLERIGAAAQAVLDEDAARPTRGARDVVEEIVAECAVLDNYATPARAIAAMRSLADQDGPAQAPWRYVVPAGPDILQLYLDYGKLIDATTMRARTNQIADRARRIWQLVAPHVALPPP